MARERKSTAGSNSGANLGFEAKLWATANALRGSIGQESNCTTRRLRA